MSTRRPAPAAVPTAAPRGDSPPLASLSVNKGRVPEPTAGWDEKSNFKVELQLGEFGKTYLPKSLEVSLGTKLPAPEKGKDFIFVLQVSDLSATIDRIEIAGFVANAVNKLVVDTLGADVFEPAFSSDFLHNCKPWMSTHSYIWYTASDEQRAAVRGALAAATLPSMEDLIVAALEPYKEGALYAIDTSTGKDWYRLVVKGKTDFLFLRQNTVASVAPGP